MPQLTFTNNLQRHIRCDPATVRGANVREVLAAYFAGNPAARTYILDEQGALRKHMLIFIDVRQIEDRVYLSDLLHGDCEAYVIQALFGGFDTTDRE